jgi:hypothetical protein
MKEFTKKLQEAWEEATKQMPLTALLAVLTGKAEMVLEEDYSAITKEVFDENGLLKVLPYSFYKQFTHAQVRLFMQEFGIYTLPTTELIDWLKENINGTTIEIACGLGSIGRALGIPITDSRQQEDPEIALYYKAMRQPTIKYPEDVKKMTAKVAVELYAPETVVASFCTHKYEEGLASGNALGVDEIDLLSKVGRYIHIGNDSEGTGHLNKPILSLSHTSIYPEWLITRGKPHKSCIKIWENEAKEAEK